MKTAVRTRWILVLAAVVLLILVAVIMTAALRPQIADPHEGQVYLYDGYDWIWMTPLENVPVNDITEDDFVMEGTTPLYVGGSYDVLRGIDVSEHQHEIDWAQVAASGVDFAFIRVGRRGYTAGAVVEDEYFKANMDGALAAGLDVGVYFFSQAINVQEAIEEAEFVLERLAPYQGCLSLPVVYDWEKIYEDDSARTAGLDAAILSDCAVAFCETVKSAGYEPAVYFNRHTGYYGLDLTRMTDYVFWFALPSASWPSFYYALDIWQYSFTENVPGIEGEIDMNLMFLPKSA